MNAINTCEIKNCLDANDNPTGGHVYGTGLKMQPGHTTKLQLNCMGSLLG